jgi:hypothetical protein
VEGAKASAVQIKDRVADSSQHAPDNPVLSGMKD